VLSVSFVKALIVGVGCGVFALAIAGPAQAAGTVPNGELNAVSCSSATACSAVGTGSGAFRGVGQTLAERWNGVRWSVQATPSHPTGSTTAVLSGVACPSARVCLAVGSLTIGTSPTYVLAERWNGTSWTAQPIPNPAGPTNPVLSAISCTSVSACTAVGWYTGSAGQTVPLAERWNGTKWAIQATPVPSDGYDPGLTGVSCASATACTAVGGDGSPSAIAERWNGVKWVVQTTPVLGNPGPYNMASAGLSSVSCKSASACMAVGNVDMGGSVPIPLAERWNGVSWTLSTMVEQSDGGPLGWTVPGVSCPSLNACTAVGRYESLNLNEVVNFAQHWNGTTWAVQNTPIPSGATFGMLSGVSCTSTSACTAVGSYFTTGNNSSQTSAERWNGRSWVVQPTP
jgi:hypothetical protein